MSELNELDKEITEKNLPLIVLHDVVAFPDCSMDFDILGEESSKSVSYSASHNDLVFLVTEKTEDDPSDSNDNVKIYNTGVIARITQHIKTSDRINRISVDCCYKAEICSIFRAKNDPKGCLLANVERCRPAADKRPSQGKTEAAMRNVKELFSQWSKIEGVSPDIYNDIEKEQDPSKLISKIVFCGCFSCEQNQELLEENSYFKALTKIFKFLSEEIEITGFQKALIRQAEINLDSERREALIKEQINILSNQLGMPADMDDEEDAQQYIEKIKAMNTDDASKEHLMKEAKHLVKLPPFSQEAYVIKNYLETVFSLPWEDEEYRPFTIEDTQLILEAGHYGMEKVKERIVETICSQIMSPKKTSNIICLVGPPGTGKTSVAKSIAIATNRNYIRVSLGGVRDESDIRGHRKTYLGSMPGRIINAIIESQSRNPVMLLDEIDKMSHDFRGDPASAMLEVLDSEQNKAFRDHYIEIPFDLSEVFFIATANDLSDVPQPLIDRMEIIELSSYTREEKFQIAKKHLIPKQREKHGLKKSSFKIADEALYNIIDFYTKEAGVRSLERNIASLCRKANKRIVSGEGKSLNATVNKLPALLGPKKYSEDELIRNDTVGMVNGLAWTSAGGVLLPVEAMTLKGKGRIQLTGSLGDVMQESAKIAISYARSVADKYGFDDDFIENSDIHIHAPEGAVPKDGPSAGVTMATAIISALSGQKVRSDIAMTGEITLHGDVLPIGGLREKTMAAYRAGINTVIIPMKNKPNMEEVDETVKSKVTFIFAKTLDDVLSAALSG